MNIIFAKTEETDDTITFKAWKPDCGFDGSICFKKKSPLAKATWDLVKGRKEIGGEFTMTKTHFMLNVQTYPGKAE